MTATLFRWDWEPSPDWVAVVDALAPRQDRSSHLVLHWEPGTPVNPVQRWVLSEALPAHYVGGGLVNALLENPPCRCPTQPADGRFRRCPRCEGVHSPGRWRTLQYYLATGCLARPFWVIQGTAGGHPFRYTDADKEWCRWLKLPDTPPAPGTLAYAPLDQRVVARIRARDRALARHATLGAALDAGTVQQEQDLRRLMVRAYAEDYTDTVADLWQGLKDEPSIRPTRSDRWERFDEDRADAEYVATGTLTY